MRTEFKMILAGFGAGALVGLVALTSVSASIDKSAGARGDRLTKVAKAQPASLSATQIVGEARVLAVDGAVVEFHDSHGTLVYRADPATASTSIAENTVVPSYNVLTTTGRGAELKLLTSAATQTAALTHAN